MKVLELNAIQLDLDEDRFLFFDPDGDRYGAFDIHILSNSKSLINIDDIIKQKEFSKDLIIIELEIDRCTVIQEDEDAENKNDSEEKKDDDKKKEIKYEKQHSVVNSSITSLSFSATEKFQTITPFENYLINELQLVNKKIIFNRQAIQTTRQTAESHRKTIGSYI
ncbi:unnamed protein product [Rotaria socialis]|uniref:Uncharacterized protein n=2 Tax=Rotaria socialis TaxID=392032 RepID=A0A820L0I0_9BILA|nr:unnamed protein product [Rotaria socialis]CAF4351426.1 unnamed protein product [Rotaria socialis]